VGEKFTIEGKKGMRWEVFRCLGEEEKKGRPVNDVNLDAVENAL
jgi:hypothetical protein